MKRKKMIYGSRKAGSWLLCALLVMILTAQTLLPGTTVLAAALGETVSLSTVCKGADGKNYQVMAAFGEDAGIPADAALTASAVTKDDADYESYVAQAAEALSCDVDEENGIRLFDISLVSGDDPSVQYQPAEGAFVEVKVRLAAAPEKTSLYAVIA